MQTCLSKAWDYELSVETVKKSWNKCIDERLFLHTCLPGIELCGIHKDHSAHSQVEPNMQHVVPELGGGTGMDKVQQACEKR